MILFYKKKNILFVPEKCCIFIEIVKYMKLNERINRNRKKIEID